MFPTFVYFEDSAFNLLITQSFNSFHTFEGHHSEGEKKTFVKLIFSKNWTREEITVDKLKTF